MQQGCVPWSNPPPSFPHLFPSRILESHPLVHNEPMSLLSLLFLIHMADFPVHDSLVERLRSPESRSFFLSVSDGSSATSSQFKRCPNFCIQHIHTYKSDRKNQNPNLSLSITNHRSLMQCKPMKLIPQE